MTNQSGVRRDANKAAEDAAASGDKEAVKKAAEYAKSKGTTVNSRDPKVRKILGRG